MEDRGIYKVIPSGVTEDGKLRATIMLSPQVSQSGDHATLPSQLITHWRDTRKWQMQLRVFSVWVTGGSCVVPPAGALKHAPECPAGSLSGEKAWGAKEKLGWLDQLWTGSMVREAKKPPEVPDSPSEVWEKLDELLKTSNGGTSLQAGSGLCKAPSPEGAASAAASATPAPPPSEAKQSGPTYVQTILPSRQSDLALLVESELALETYRQVLSGPHHAIHEFSFDAVGWPNGPVTIVIHWFFTTGHDHPVWSVTFDMTRAPPNMLDSDDRSPYGDLTFEGGTNGTVDGVGWGDKYKFVTTSAGPVTKSSTWDYSQPNRVPYVHMWNDASDSEMGNVQTIEFASKDAGGTWFYDNWGRTSANKVVGPGAPANQTMPVSWNWPFQLNQYEVDFGETRSKRMAWGLRRGAVGSTSYSGYGDERQLSGYPYQSHSNVLVLGAKSEGAVAAEVAEIEASMDTTVDVVKGAVRTAGPEGIARTASAPYAVAGWSPVYGAWQLDYYIVPTADYENPCSK